MDEDIEKAKETRVIYCYKRRFFERPENIIRKADEIIVVSYGLWKGYKCLIGNINEIGEEREERINITREHLEKVLPNLRKTGVFGESDPSLWIYNGMNQITEFRFFEGAEFPIFAEKQCLKEKLERIPKVRKRDLLASIVMREKPLASFLDRIRDTRVIYESLGMKQIYAHLAEKQEKTKSDNKFPWVDWEEDAPEDWRRNYWDNFGKKED